MENRSRQRNKENRPEQLTQLVRKRYRDLTTPERAIVNRISRAFRFKSRNSNEAFTEQLTLGDRVADRVASFGGSWTFICIFGGILLVWVLLNSAVLIHFNASFDPYPYILLNLFLSMLAAIQAPIIMMSQNRQAEKDRIKAENDYEVNLKAELEILQLHEKVDELREHKWMELIQMQQQQIDILQKLLGERESDRVD